MSDRYQQVYTHPTELYAVGSPVVLAAGALLKDTVTGQTLAQIKLRSIETAKPIKALSVRIQPKDTTDKPLGDALVHKYLDLNAGYGDEFGSRTPVVMPDPTTRGFDAEVTEVIFSDNTTVAVQGAWEPLPQPTPLSSELTKELEKQYRIESGKGADYVPQPYKDLFGCTCGELHRAADCPECGRNYADCRKHYEDRESLTERCNARLAKEEAERQEAERKAEERRIAAEKAKKKVKKAFAIGTPIVAACIAFVIVLTTIISTANRNKAYDIYGDILNTAKVGDTITFGKYEQDNNTSNGKEEIEWIVLAKENGKILVISKYALDCQRYNTTYTNVTWETCSLRKWLNGTFMNDAFDSPEKEIIAKETVSADKNPKYSMNPGNSTNDKVFLLSITEVKKYFTTDEARKCAPTAYAKSQGAWTSDSYKTASGEATCWWWLRSPGPSQNHAAYVNIGGSVDYYGRSVDNDNDCVRPAMWISLD